MNDDAQARLTEAYDTAFKAMVGTVRTDRRGLEYRVERVVFNSASRNRSASVTVKGRVITYGAQDKFGNSLYDAYASEIFYNAPEEPVAVETTTEGSELTAAQAPTKEARRNVAEIPDRTG